MRAKAIIAGAFSAETQAVQAVDQLLSACARGDRVHTFLSTPAGPAGSRRGSQADAVPVGKKNGPTTPANGDAAACTIGLEVALTGAADGVEVTASMGALTDVLGGIAGGQAASGAAPHRNGITVAIETSDFTSQLLAVDVLRQCGACVTTCLTRHAKKGRWPGLSPVSLSSVIERKARREASAKAVLLDPGFTRLRH